MVFMDSEFISCVGPGANFEDASLGVVRPARKVRLAVDGGVQIGGAHDESAEINHATGFFREKLHLTHVRAAYVLNQ